MSRTRDDIENDLPFYVNGTLSAAESAEVEAWLADDDALRDAHDALARIRAGMQAEEVRSPGEFGLARLMRDAGREDVPVVANAPNRTWIWQVAAAVAMAGFLGQALLMRSATEPVYQLASAMASGDLTVAFMPDATEAQIRTLLHALNVEIVAGPSALGFYRLDVLDGGDKSTLLGQLQAATGIIESVEDAEN